MPPPHLPSTSRIKKKQQHQKLQDPETADEFLAAGVEHEEAAEKWRAGDAAKACRMALRALEVYNSGLHRFPTDFDLAYNVARLQYQITQHTGLMAEYPASYKELLETAVTSHRRALALATPNADILFNTAQVLTSFAEAISSMHDRSALAIQYLEEAAVLFQHCLVLQEKDLIDQNKNDFLIEKDRLPSNESALAEDVNPGLDATMEETSNREEWVTIVQEPITRTSLVDTIIALLDSFGTQCALLSNGMNNKLTAIEEIGSEMIQEKLPAIFNTDKDKKMQKTSASDALLSSIKFKAAALEAEFRLGMIDTRIYSRQLKEIFAPAGLDSWRESPWTAEFYSAYADALISYSEATASAADAGVSRWSSLVTSLECLSKALQAPGNVDKVELNLTRGDVEMLRYRLTVSTNLPSSISNDQVRATLLQNAETYYRGAGNLIKNTYKTENDFALGAATVKQAVAASIASQNHSQLDLLRKDGLKDSTIQSIITEMIEENLITLEDIQFP